LEQIRPLHKKQRIKGIPLSDTSLAEEGLSRYSFQQDRRGTRGENFFNPLQEKLRETFCSHNLDNGIMIKSIKSLFKINFEHHNFPFGLLALE
jgi:hypothetical protein